MDNYDCLVVGAGSIGWIAARAFAFIDHSVGLVGPQSVPSGDKYLGLSWKTLQRLQDLGIDLFSLDQGKMTELYLGRALSLGWVVRSQRNGILGFNIHHQELYQLCHAFPPKNLSIIPESIVNVVELKTGYILTTSSGKKLQCKRLIATDGQSSFIRNTLRPKWKEFQRLSKNAYISMQPSLGSPSSSYQYFLKDGGVLAVLPTDQPEQSYCVWTGLSCQKVPFQKYIQVPLWSYQLENSLQQHISYIGWAGQSWDPTCASGMNHAIWEIFLLVEAISAKNTEDAFRLLLQRVAQRRKLIAQILRADKLFLRWAHVCPRSVLRSALEILTEQSLDLEPSLCPHVLI